MILGRIFFISMIPLVAHASVIKTNQNNMEVQKITKRKTITPQKKSSSEKNRIIIKNNIAPEALKYQHWTGTYEPEFNISINGQEIKTGKKIEIAPKDQKLEVQYNYSFAAGYKKGTRKVTFKIPENTKDIGLTFSWDDKYRVIADNATPLSIEKVNKKEETKEIAAR